MSLNKLLITFKRFEKKSSNDLKRSNIPIDPFASGENRGKEFYSKTEYTWMKIAEGKDDDWLLHEVDKKKKKKIKSRN